MHQVLAKIDVRFFYYGITLNNEFDRAVKFFFLTKRGYTHILGMCYNKLLVLFFVIVEQLILPCQVENYLRRVTTSYDE